METIMGKHVEKLFEKGQLISNSDVFSIVSNTMVREALRGYNSFVLDGFPREIQQGIAFEEEIWRCQLVLSLGVDEETALKRRWEWAKVSECVSG